MNISGVRIFRKVSLKGLIISAIGLTILLCLYYTSYTSDVNTTSGQSSRHDNNYETGDLKRAAKLIRKFEASQYGDDGSLRRHPEEMCPVLDAANVDIDTVEVFKDFEFQPTWLKSKEYWDKMFEDRFERQKLDPSRLPLKVIIVPHSHNDPGWLKTFENYFHSASRQIINNMVSKLWQYKNLTFIWSETSFLNAWWEEAHPSKQKMLRNLVQSGRLEITTGGWVMTDEANVHIYAMLDQLIEGHQWIWSNLGIKPKSGWSVDPFGHGSTVPYLLGSSGIKGTVIQRIHYAWKQWLAMKQYGDFKWVPTWSPYDSKAGILTHNQPFDIYSIKHSCGPHTYICLNFDFRKVIGEYTEYSIKAQSITDKNVKEKAELLLEQYARTGSLLPHNVVLMPLGDDFRYNIVEEFDQQYTNYIKLIDYINANKHIYKAEVKFGTPADYFEEILKRHEEYPTLKGDFFVYSDIFSEGRPAYWSGYYTTRPFMKLLDRKLENTLRGAEILYTIAYNKAKKDKLVPHMKILERDFERLVKARRNLGLFQHHDAITGTSKSYVMRDYGLRLFDGIRDTIRIQQNALQSLMYPKMPIKPDVNLLLNDVEYESFDKLPAKTPILLGPADRKRKIVLYNSLAQEHEYLVNVLANTSNVKVTDEFDKDVIYQVNPIWVAEEGSSKLEMENSEFEIIFIAKLPALSVTIFHINYEESDNKTRIYCSNCVKEKDTKKSKFIVKDIPTGDIQLENIKLKLLFNGNTGFLKTVTRKHNPKIMQCAIQFAAYRSAQFHSGAYLFMPDPNERDYEKDVLQQYKDQMSIIITTGPVATELTVIYGPFLMHSVTIFLQENTGLSNGIYIENIVDFENPPKNRETELFMRIVSDVQNGEPPEFYSDLNGFSMQKRIKVERIGLEGNYFPITSMAYIQDEKVRLSLLTNHAQGAASWQPGFLEVMLERRTLYDDSRGMGEGVVDNKRTESRYWLLIEDMDQVIKKDGKKGEKRLENDDDGTFDKGEIVRSFNLPTEQRQEAERDGSTTNMKGNEFSRPSLFANRISNMLNYPASVFLVETGVEDGLSSENIMETKSVNLINKQLPCDMHLLTLRTQPDAIYSQFPSSSALMVLHRQGYDCSVNSNFTCDAVAIDDATQFQFVNVKSLDVMSLTGIDKLHRLDSLKDVHVDVMSLKTFNITFG